MAIDGIKGKDFGVNGQGNKTAADLYEVQSCYQCFDQKNKIPRRPFWKSEAVKLTRKRNENRTNTFDQ